MRSVVLASASSLALIVSSSPSHAQSAQAYRNWDENGVDLVRGDFRLNFEEASIGSGRARLSLVRQSGNVLLPFEWDNLKLVRSGIGTITTTARKPSDTSFKFTGSTSDLGDGATLQTGTYYSFIKDSDGVTYYYENPLDPEAGANNLCSSLKPPPCELPLASITYPDGKIITITNGTWWNTTTNVVSTRVVNVSNNFGYDLDFKYSGGGIIPRLHVSAPTDPTSAYWTRVSTSLRRSEVTQATVSYAYPVSGTVDITDPAGQVWTVTALSIKKPGDATPSFVVTGSPTVTSVMNAGVTTNYNRSVVGSAVTLTKTDPLGKQTVITSDSSIARVKSIKDPLNRTMSYQYDEFGQPQNTNIGVWGYTGQAWIPEISEWYFKARVFEPELGRFLQPDPIGYESSANLYEYVENDPNNGTDPSGLRPWTIGERTAVRVTFNGLVKPVPVYAFGFRSATYPYEIDISWGLYRSDFSPEFSSTRGTDSAKVFWHEVYHLFEIQLGIVSWSELLENQLSVGFSDSIYDYDPNKSFMEQNPEARAKYFAGCMTRGMCSALRTQFLWQKSRGEWVIFTGYTFKVAKIPVVIVLPPDPDKDKKDDPPSED